MTLRIVRLREGGGRGEWDMAQFAKARVCCVVRHCTMPVGRLGSLSRVYPKKIKGHP